MIYRSMSHTEILDAINAACNTLGAYPPKVVGYSNGVLVVLRNGDGQRVAKMIDNGTKPEDIHSVISGLYKIKAENQPTEATMARLLSPEEIRAYQQGKKDAKA